MAKKVFFVIDRLGGKGWGGAHRVVAILANYLAKKNHDVTMIVWRDSSIDYPLDSAIKINWLHCKIVRELDMIAPCLKTRKILSKHKGAYVYVFMSRMATYAVLYSLFLDVNIIGSERTDPRTEPHKAIFRSIRNLMFGFLYRAVYQTPDAMSYFPKRAQRIGLVIPNPLSPKLPKRFEGERKKEFVTFCRIDKQKNLPMMIDAFIKVYKQHPEFVLRIYGTGLIEKEIRDYIVNNNATSFILMEGFHRDVHNRIRDSYAFLSSSDYEGISNSMLEAMAIGMPCICTDCPMGGAKMFIDNGSNGLLVPVNEVDAMADAINKLIADSDFCYQLSVNASKLNEILNEQKICEQWERLMY